MKRLTNRALHFDLRLNWAAKLSADLVGPKSEVIDDSMASLASTESAACF
jgi:hypothetical protein